MRQKYTFTRLSSQHGVAFPLGFSDSVKVRPGRKKIVNFIFYSARWRSNINIIVSADVELVKCFIKERFSTWNLSNFEFPNLLNFTRETSLNCKKILQQFGNCGCLTHLFEQIVIFLMYSNTN